MELVRLHSAGSEGSCQALARMVLTTPWTPISTVNQNMDRQQLIGVQSRKIVELPGLFTFVSTREPHSSVKPDYSLRSHEITLCGETTVRVRTTN